MSRTILVFLALVALDTIFAPVNSAKLQDRIVAIVNSDLIMLSDVKRDLTTEQERLQKRYKGTELERRLKSAEYVTLTKMIERKLQLQAARTKGVEVTESFAPWLAVASRSRNNGNRRTRDISWAKSMRAFFLAPGSTVGGRVNGGHDCSRVRPL